MLNIAEVAGRLQGITICANAHIITHLLFANDASLLLKANRDNATYLHMCSKCIRSVQVR